jgi:hypothetical protein
MTTTEAALRFTVELTEDLHAGSGVGTLGLVDDRHCRDSAGRPVVWWSTFRGLLREAGEDHLLSLKQAAKQISDAEAKEKQIESVIEKRKLLYKLLGKPVNDTTEDGDGRQSGLCQIRSLRLKEGEGGRPDEDYFANWTSSSREVHSRRPMDSTLRTVEMSRSGLKFEGEIRVPVTCDQDKSLEELCEIKLLKACLRRMRSLGGGKTRGWGQIFCHDVSAERLGIGMTGRIAPEIPSPGPVRLRLLLRSLEPLGLTTTALAGNLLQCQSYLSGSRLRGSLLHWLSERNISVANSLADPSQFQVGNAYVIPSDLAPKDSKLGDIELIPAPLSLREHKAGRVTGSRTTSAVADRDVVLPWWTLQRESNDLGSRDEMDAVARYREIRGAAIAKADPLQGRKRIKADEFLVRKDSSACWRRVKPKLGVLLRNRVPTVRLDPFDRLYLPPDERKSHPDRKDQEGSQTDALFSQQVMVEDQLFLTDLWFAEAEKAKEFLEQTAPLWEPQEKDQENNQLWLRVGRAGQPVRIERWDIVNGSNDTANRIDPNLLVLTFTSDLIARTPFLQFCTDMTAEDLARLVNEATGDNTPPIHLNPGTLIMNDKESVYETVEVYGFNSASGLPRAMAVGFKRGSVFVVEPKQANDSEAQAQIKALRDALLKLQRNGIPLGERIAEGFGRFAVDLYVHDPDYWRPVAGSDTRTSDSNSENTRKENWHESVLLDRDNYVRALAKADLKSSISQWRWLRDEVRRRATFGALDELWKELEEHSHKKAGEIWKGWSVRLKNSIARYAGHIDRAKFFVDSLAAWAVEQKRREHAPRRVPAPPKPELQVDPLARGSEGKPL